ncbi:MAG: DUF1254 domain-containing protein, partial [Desulfobacterales bacterium]|nr:DUF1254 domain-containing protein [Desulfobacterales bacterium]
MKLIQLKTLTITMVLLASSFMTLLAAEVKITKEEAKQIAKDAYIYGFPMVVNYKTMVAYTLDKNSPEFKGDFNELGCEARVYTPDDKAIVTPNSDTPYCMGWVDIRKDPIVISVPEMEPERFYHFQLVDLYTHNFAYLGTLTTGNKAGKYLIVNQSWKGKKPKGINNVIRCETDIFFVIVRTQLMNKSDLEKVKQIQGEYHMQPLSAYLGNGTPKAALKNDFPKWNEGDQFTSASFKYLDVMINSLEPVSEEKALMERFARLGIGTDKGFDINRFDEETQKAIEQGVKDGFKTMESFLKEEGADPLASAKIFGTRKFLKKSAKENYQLEDFYVLRAVAAHTGLYGNSGAEATYPTYLSDSEGNPPNTAENKYTITFQKEELPPVKAFWSLTIYDGRTQLLVENSLDRYLLNSNMKDDFVYGGNGSLTLYM